VTTVELPTSRPWGRRAGGVLALVVAACFVPGDGVGLLTALAVLGLVGHGVLRSWAAVGSVLLPRSERAPWRAEVRAVLDAAQDGRERRRQLRGFILGLPACALTSWLLVLRR
jgi:hypothetical protein